MLMFIQNYTRWRFVTHAGIDGYSRVVVFCGVGNNNRADTVMELFREAVNKWSVPSRVR